jgi:dihydrofolate synthase/folylpolyglutamate synthase
VTIPGEDNPLPDTEIAEAARSVGIAAETAPSVEAAVRKLAARGNLGRILICGSLHLCGVVLAENG